FACLTDDRDTGLPVLTSWLDVSRMGDIVRSRWTTGIHPRGSRTLAPLLTRSDGLEITVGYGPNATPQAIQVAEPGNGAVLFHPLTMVGVTHTSPILSRDGSFVYYLVSNLDGALYRMQLP